MFHPCLYTGLFQTTVQQIGRKTRSQFSPMLELTHFKQSIPIHNLCDVNATNLFLNNIKSVNMLQSEVVKRLVSPHWADHGCGISLLNPPSPTAGRAMYVLGVVCSPSIIDQIMYALGMVDQTWHGVSPCWSNHVCTRYGVSPYWSDYVCSRYGVSPIGQTMYAAGVVSPLLVRLCMQLVWCLPLLVRLCMQLVWCLPYCSDYVCSWYSVSPYWSDYVCSRYGVSPIVQTMYEAGMVSPPIDQTMYAACIVSPLLFRLCMQLVWCLPLLIIHGRHGVSPCWPNHVCTRCVWPLFFKQLQYYIVFHHIYYQHWASLWDTKTNILYKLNNAIYDHTDC